MVDEVFGVWGRDRCGELVGQEPPAVVLDAEMEEEDQEEQLEEEREGFRQEVARLEAPVEAVKQQELEHAGLIAGVQATLAALPESPPPAGVGGSDPVEPRFVWGGTEAEPYHAVASAHPLMGPELHVTRCGWAFGLTLGVRRRVEPPEGVRPCETCYPELRKPKSRRKPSQGV